MPGRTTADNKFGPGPFVCGPILGEGVNYSTIQSAVDAAALAGYPVVYVRPNTYTENVVFPPEVTLVGAQADGRNSYVLINGNSTASGSGVFAFRNIAFTAAVGDVFFSDAGGGTQEFRFDNCYVTGGAGVNGIALDASGGTVLLAVEDSSLGMQGNGINLTGGCAATIEGSTISSGTGIALNLSGAGNSAEIRASKLTAQNDDAISIGNNSGSVIISSSDLMAGDAGFDIGAGSSVQATHCTLESNNATGFWVTGGGDFSYADMVLTGTAIDIDTASLNSVTALPWQQYGEAAAAGPGSVRGTASFNSADFTVVDGFVSAAGAGGGVSLSPYIVGPTNSDYTVIQDAIDQAVLDGASASNPYNIYIKPKNGGYFENLSLSDGINLIGFNNVSSRVEGSSGAVLITGTITLNGGTNLVKNMRITSFGNQFDISDATTELFLDNVAIDSSPAFNGTLNNLVVVHCYNCALFTSLGVFNITSSSSFVLDFVDVRAVANLGASNFTSTGGTGVMTFRAQDSYMEMNVTSTGNFTVLMDNSHWTTTQDYLVDAAGTQSLFEANHCFLSCGVSALNANTNSTLKLYFTEFDYTNLPTPEFSFGGFAELTQSKSYLGEVYRDVETNTFHGTYSSRQQAVVTTAGAVTVDIASIDVQDDEMIGIFCRYTAFRDNFSAAQSGTLIATGRAAAGVATLAGTPVSVPSGDAALAAAAISAVAAGATIRIQVTGVAAGNLNWSVDYEVLHTQSDA